MSPESCDVRGAWHPARMNPNERQIITDAELLLRDAVAALTEPERRECLACFVFRQLSEFGCDGTLRFARRSWRVCCGDASHSERSSRQSAVWRSICDGVAGLHYATTPVAQFRAPGERYP